MGEMGDLEAFWKINSIHFVHCTIRKILFAYNKQRVTGCVYARLVTLVEMLMEHLNVLYGGIITSALGGSNSECRMQNA